APCLAPVVLLVLAFLPVERGWRACLRAVPKMGHSKPSCEARIPDVIVAPVTFNQKRVCSADDFLGLVWSHRGARGQHLGPLGETAGEQRDGGGALCARGHGHGLCYCEYCTN